LECLVPNFKSSPVFSPWERNIALRPEQAFVTILIRWRSRQTMPLDGPLVATARGICQNVWLGGILRVDRRGGMAANRQGGSGHRVQPSNTVAGRGPLFDPYEYQ
jgi:hypothetical protein